MRRVQEDQNTASSWVAAASRTFGFLSRSRFATCIVVYAKYVSRCLGIICTCSVLDSVQKHHAFQRIV